MMAARCDAFLARQTAFGNTPTADRRMEPAAVLPDARVDAVLAGDAAYNNGFAASPVRVAAEPGLPALAAHTAALQTLAASARHAGSNRSKNVTAIAADDASAVGWIGFDASAETPEDTCP